METRTCFPKWTNVSTRWVKSRSSHNWKATRNTRRLKLKTIIAKKTVLFNDYFLNRQLRILLGPKQVCTFFWRPICDAVLSGMALPTGISILFSTFLNKHAKTLSSPLKVLTLLHSPAVGFKLKHFPPLCNLPSTLTMSYDGKTGNGHGSPSGSVQ